MLREQGVIFVKTGTREQTESYAYVPFFPSALAVIGGLLPDRTQMCDPFEKAGFRMTAWELITQTIAPNWTAYAERLAAGGDSVLAQLSPEELDRGLAAVRRQGASVVEADSEPIDLFLKPQ